MESRLDLLFLFFFFLKFVYLFIYFFNNWAQHVNKAKEKLPVMLGFSVLFLTVGKSVYLS